MNVRLASLPDDSQAVLAGAKDFISRMDFTEGLPDSDEELLGSIYYLASVGLEIAVAEEGGEIVGGIGILYAPFPWNRSKIVASEMFIWAKRGAPPLTFRALMRFVSNRMLERKVVLREFVALTSSPSGLGRIYEKMGLRKVQETYMGAV